MDRLIFLLSSELQSLERSIERASTDGKILQFINSIDTVDTLKSHNGKLDNIIVQLTVCLFLPDIGPHILNKDQLDVSTYTGQTITHVHTGVKEIQAGVTRVEVSDCLALFPLYKP